MRSSAALIGRHDIDSRAHPMSEAIPVHEPFEEPWQARLFGTAVATVDGLGLSWDEMRVRLKAAIAADPDRPYHESLLAAFEVLLEDERLLEAPTR
jgi:hypothetical protein